MERGLINCGTCGSPHEAGACSLCVDMSKWMRREGMEKEYSHGTCMDSSKSDAEPCNGCTLLGVGVIPLNTKGVDKNTEIVEAEPGCKGKQSPAFYRFDLIDTKALFNLAEILKIGVDKYGESNWRQVPEKNHINEALSHLWAYLDGDTQDDHLGHAFCRIMMALAKKLEK